MTGADGAVRVDKRGCDHIFFIGFLGAGKSTLARNLGGLFHRRFVDTDRLVERRAGKSISRIFAEEGEAGFRALETEVLRSLESQRSLLVSCGGGIVETPENIELMHEMGYCVYLDGDLDDSLRQIRSLKNRPDFRSPEHAERLFRHRAPLYRQAADLTVDIRGRTFEEVSYRCAGLLLERGLL
ncbi:MULTISPECIES: shikimate kinase [Enorma]|uniref:Shikimate kinase n=1 Tax=[Collinsella] massiliensis TaxID=1232426 RepID=A0A1Y3XTU5_9ACTN|nr:MULTISPECIES: shikimate kinase [Enorma]OUN88953.1 shikimate kinase [[Collinsella] massiliensis]